MQTKDTAVATTIRSWAGHHACDDYKDMAAEMADAIRERAQSLDEAQEFGRVPSPTEVAAIAEVKHNMPCGYNSPRSWWAWYNESCTGTDRG